MSDLISRKEAIYTIHKEFDKLENVDCDGWEIANDIEECLKDVPTVEQNVVNLGHVAKVNSITMIQNLDWIPVTERLPELKERVLVYAEDAESWWIAISQIISPPSPKVWFLGFNGTQKVKAWMPLPTPWKGEENDK